MKKMLSLLLGLIFLSNTVFVQTAQGQSGVPNTPEQIARLNFIRQKMIAFKLMVLPLLLADIKHFNELHHTGVNIENYVEQFQKMYPRTSRYVEEQLGKRNGTANSVVTARLGPGGAGILWRAFKDILFVAGLYAFYNAEQEQNFYNDLIDRGIDPELAEKEANYQSDRAAVATPPSIAAIAEVSELYAEANDRSRYNLEEYILRTLAGPLRPLSPGGRYPISVGGDGAMIIGTPGPGGGCVIVGPGAMPNSGAPGTDLPRFDDEITVIGTPLPPC